MCGPSTHLYYWVPITYFCYIGFAIYGIAHNSDIIDDKQGILLERAEPVKSDWMSPFIQDLKVIDKDETCGPAAFSGFQKTFPGFMGVWKKGKTPGSKVIDKFDLKGYHWKVHSGYCLDSRGNDQNHMQTLLYTKDLSSKQARLACFDDAWAKYGDSISAIEIYRNKNCVVHQSDVAGGNGARQAVCVKKMEVSTVDEDTELGEAFLEAPNYSTLETTNLKGYQWNVYRGFCLDSQDKDQNTKQTHLHRNKDYRTQEARLTCFNDAWARFGDSVTAVEIWDNKNCLVHQSDVGRGNELK